MRAGSPACTHRWPKAAAALVDGKTLARMGEVSMATHDDATLRIPTRFALGFMKSMDNRKRSVGAKLFGPDVDSVIMGSAAFGHVGAGGSLGFADPAAGLSFGYTMNRMGPGLLMNERGQALVDAAYLSLGYKNKDGGVWVNVIPLADPLDDPRPSPAERPRRRHRSGRGWPPRPSARICSASPSSGSPPSRSATPRATSMPRSTAPCWRSAFWAPRCSTAGAPIAP